jgi:hypothetical protein
MAKIKNLSFILNDKAEVLCEDGKFRLQAIHNDRKKKLRLRKIHRGIEKFIPKVDGVRRWTTVYLQVGDIVHCNGDVRRRSGDFEQHGRPTKKTNIGLYIKEEMLK